MTFFDTSTNPGFGPSHAKPSNLVQNAVLALARVLGRPAKASKTPDQTWAAEQRREQARRVADNLLR